LAGLDLIQVAVLGGDDSVSISSAVTLPAVVDGGSGKDNLNSSNAPGSILIGGAGTDSLTGGSGRDILIGGLGADRLIGNSADDILIAGRTSYDSGADDDKLTNDFKLLKLYTEWNSTRSYADRIANIQDGKGPVLAGSGLSLKQGLTVFDDSDADTLTGSANGLDWFFIGPKDKITDKAKGEIVV
jgi:Ca2+-binding RTX toxin-like protein